MAPSYTIQIRICPCSREWGLWLEPVFNSKYTGIKWVSKYWSIFGGLVDSADQAHGKTLVNQYIDVWFCKNKFKSVSGSSRPSKFKWAQRFTSLASTLVEQPPKYCWPWWERQEVFLWVGPVFCMAAFSLSHGGLCQPFSRKQWRTGKWQWAFSPSFKKIGIWWPSKPKLSLVAPAVPG